jgi:hypothetical protein
MAEEKTFEELLDEAPLAASEDTVTLIGALERSHTEGKFVLVLGGGLNLTLDVAAVKKHQVLGSTVGQRLVRVEVDREGLPSGLQDRMNTDPQADFGVVPKAPPGDSPPIGTLQEHLPFGTMVEQLPQGGWVDPYQGVVNPGFAAGVPFALATPHHVSAEILARLSPMFQFPSIPWWTEHLNTVPEWDFNRKMATDPSLDIREGGTSLFYDYV